MNEALRTWKEKLEYLQVEEAKATDPAQKFKLKKDIEEAEAKIAELEAAERQHGPEAESAQVEPISGEPNRQPPLPNNDRKPLPGLAPEVLTALVNKKAQASHIKDRAFPNAADRQPRHWAFIVTGLAEEWPDAIKEKLAYLLQRQERAANDGDFPERVQLTWPSGRPEPDAALIEMLAESLHCDNTVESVRVQLAHAHVPRIFWLSVVPNDLPRHDYFCDLAKHWETLGASGTASQTRFLVLVVETREVKRGFFRADPLKQASQSMSRKFAREAQQHAHCLLPPLASPGIDDVSSWLNDHDRLRPWKQTVLQEITPHFAELPSIPHERLSMKLKEILDRVLKS